MSETFDPYQQWLDIDPRERPIDHYRLLGVKRFESDPAVILAAADQRMMKIRSYQTGPHAAVTQVLLNEIAAAKICLLKPATKATYDAVLQGQLAATPPIARPAPRSHPQLPGADVSLEPPLPSNAKESDKLAGMEKPVYAQSWFPLAVLITLVLLTAGVWIGGMLLTRNSRPDGNGENTPPKRQALPPQTTTIIVQQADGEIIFPISQAKLHGENLQQQTHAGQRVLGNWQSSDDSMSWQFHVNKPSYFRVKITYLAPPAIAGGRYELAVGKSKAASDVQVGSDTEPVTDTLQLVVRRAGDHTLSLRAVNVTGEQFIQLKSIRLLPK